ncbi:uncharacterized protein LOC119325281 isoform X2 [Triticum dicoccoides]|uniref:uncharacterized protein LOC119325281 isoform X2 n=1 Tax=Triticum dicoccoides TaxID=85692 RepID=UPI0018916596|nr:uncharacterized protein LOC119325281 isoform X2 [Triticum dicoccoides]XP_037454924.1 uncharacterized protein LOC119325281 isoform X2 [Triticum dicoccoides]
MGDGAADELETHPRPKEMASLPIPDELAVEIFLRIPNPADLLRASAACVSFRGLIADRAFLRRYRKIHAPPLLGFLEYDHKVFHPAAPPHTSAPAASAAALAADFSFSFLPAPTSDWRVQDVRDGRVLLDRAPQHDIDNRYSVVFPELVVCDPLHRRYLLLPPVPAHLAATVEDPLWIKRHRYCETFLAPPADGGEAPEETSFRVVWMAQCETKLVAFVFSSSTEQWRAIPSQSWSDLFAGLLSLTGLTLFSWHQYAYGCFYWVTDWRERLLVLDTRRMEFSISESPIEARGLEGVAIAIVEAGEGMPGMFIRAKDPAYVNYTIRRNNCGSSSQWQLEKTISLDSRYLFIDSTERHLFLYQCPSRSLDAGCFSLDLKTFQLETVFVSNSFAHIAYAYSNFPPSLSTPAVSTGFGNKAEEEMLEQGGAASTSAESPRSE